MIEKNKKSCLLFDVDGTLTLPRQPIDSNFKELFLTLCRDKRYLVNLISGSDYPKLKEQLGEEILGAVVWTYASAGNVRYCHNEFEYANEYEFPQELFTYLESILYQNAYSLFRGKQIEVRQGGMINFSIIGRNASSTERTNYYKWDLVHEQRLKIIETINKRWPHLSAELGGQISIDIYPKDKDKSQILDVWPDMPIYFFCDKGKTKEGNDYSLVQALLKRGNSLVYHTKHWEDTCFLLRNFV